LARRFAQRLAERVAARRSQLVLGLDPDPARLWPSASTAGGGTGGPGERAAAAVADHCRAAIAAAGEACVGVKLQLACFERLGAPGWAALAAVAEHARTAGLLVVADGKRGDVPVTAAAYAQALVGATPSQFGEVPGLGADALTANPLLGADSLAPLVEAARASAAGVFVLVRTSNPGAADLQDLPTAGSGAPVPLWERIAALVAGLGDADGDAPELSDVGAVVGATAPEHLPRMRELMPRSIFLVPGVGAQGGRVEDLAAAFTPSPAAALVTVSRGVVQAHERTGGEPEQAAHDEAHRLRESIWSIGGRG
jgi:orotidine-5'-phosphate decarboxylase